MTAPPGPLQRTLQEQIPLAPSYTPFWRWLHREYVVVTWLADIVRGQ